MVMSPPRRAYVILVDVICAYDMTAVAFYITVRLVEDTTSELDVNTD